MDFENRKDHLIDVRHVRGRNVSGLSAEEQLDSIIHEVSEPVTAVILNATAVRQALSIDPPNIAIAMSAVRCLIRDSRDIVEMVTRLTAPFRGKSISLTARSEIEEFFPRLRSTECREALTAFFEKRPPNFNRTRKTPTVA